MEDASLMVLINDTLRPELTSYQPLASFLQSSPNDSLDTLLPKLNDTTFPIAGHKYLKALIVQKAEESDSPIGHEKSNRVLNSYFELCRSLGVDAKTYQSSIINIYTREIMNCEGLDQQFFIASQVRKIADVGIDVSILEAALDVSYSPDIFESALHTSKEGILESLKGLNRAKELKLDSTGAFEAIVGNALQWIEESNDFFNLGEPTGGADIETTRKMNRILEELNIEDPDVKARAQALKEKYGMEAAPIPAPVIPSADRIEGEITSSQEIEFIGDARKVSHNTEKTIYTRIFKARVKRTGEVIAVKKITSERGRQLLDRYNEEISIMRRLSGQQKSFLRFRGTYFDGDSVFMLMEFVDGTLKDFIQSTKTYTEVQQLEIGRSLVEGFAFMASMSIFHRDIKPDNILIAQDSIAPKIIDFGITVFDYQQSFNTTTNSTHFVQGTDGYMSPEQKKAVLAYRANPATGIKKYDIEKSDVYSLGLTLIQLILRIDVSAYEFEQNNQELLKKVGTISSARLRTALTKMVQLDPNSRPKFSQLIPDFPGSTQTVPK